MLNGVWRNSCGRFPIYSRQSREPLGLADGARVVVSFDKCALRHLLRPILFLLGFHGVRQECNEFVTLNAMDVSH